MVVLRASGYTESRDNRTPSALAGGTQHNSKQNTLLSQIATGECILR